MSTKSLRILGAGAMLTLALCAPPPASATRCERQAPGSMTVQRDVAYGPAQGQQLDVYLPPHAHDAPVLLLVHGGAWMIGDKASRRFIRDKVAHWVTAGAIVVSTNYRMQAPVDPRREVEDVARALAWVQRHAPNWGGNPQDVTLVGHSAGAHLVALLTAAPGIARGQGATSWAGTVALDSAAYDLVRLMNAPHRRFYDRVFGSDPSFWRAMSPTLRVRAATPPMLLVCSTRRETSCSQARAFAARAKSLGSRVTVMPVDMTHEQINRDLGAGNDYTHRIDAAMQALGLGPRACAQARSR